MRLRTISLAGVAVALLVTGCSSTTKAAAPRGSAAPGGTAAPATGGSFAPVIADGPVHLTAYSTDDGPDSTIVLSGAIGDYGTARSVHPDGSVDPDHGSQLDLRLSHGTLRLDLTALDRAFVQTAGTLRIDTNTCSATTSATANVAIVPGSGTGAYRAITGSFDLAVTLDEVYRPTECTETGSYLSQIIVITGSGTVTVG